MEAKASSKGAKEVSKPLNYVHKQIIHAETIGKERKYESKNFKYEYTFSPYTFYPITEKPTNIEPSRPFTGKEFVEKQSRRDYKVNLEPIPAVFMKDRISRSIAKLHQTPKERYDIPQTSSQAYGWYSKPLMDNKKWNRPVTSTHITKFVSDYHQLMGINPFKLPTSSIKMK